MIVMTVGSKDFERRLNLLAQRLTHPASAMRKIAQTLETLTDQNFAAQGRPRWMPLSAATIRARLGGKKAYTKKGILKKSAQAYLSSMRMLQVTGQLAASIHSASGDDWAMIGAGTKYARIHQLGGRAGRNNKVYIPARPYLPFTANKRLQPEAEKAILETLERHLRATL